MQTIRRILHLRISFRVSQKLKLLHDVSTTENQTLSNRNVPLYKFNHTETNYQNEENKKILGKISRSLKLIFTCKKCKTRNSKTISKLAYEKGIVIVRCDGCLNNHLIADNLSWFTNNQERINIESIMKKKGESVRRVLNCMDGYYEAIPSEIQELNDNTKSGEINAEHDKDSKSEHTFNNDTPETRER